MELIARIREKRRIATLTKADKFTPCGMNIYHYFGSRSKRFPNVYYSFLFKIVSDAFLNANNSNAYYFNMLLRNALRGLFQFILCARFFYAAELSGQFNVSEGRELFVIFVIFFVVFFFHIFLLNGRNRYI